MRILLVLPAADRYRVTRAAPRPPRRAPLRFSLLPLTTVAALTPPGHQVILCDENVEPLDTEAEVDLVGVGFMTALAPRAYQIAAAFRARGRRVVAGGYHPTLCTDEVLDHFDAVVAGEAEGAWPALLADAERGALRRVYRAGPLPRAGAPPPRRDLQARIARHYITTAAVQVGRGCAHACRYCSIAAFHPSGYRARPVAEVVEELRGLPRDLILVDDNVIADPAHARELLRAMAPLGKRWVGQCSIRIADDPELLALARRSGCAGLFIGLETLSAANLAAVDKSFADAHGYRVRLRAIRRAGVGVIAGIMVGLDADDATVFERTLRFLERNRVDAVQVNILTPLPGTPLFEQFRRSGRIASTDWSRYDFRHCVIRPARMSAEELQAGADWMYRRFYRLDRVLLRALRSALDLGPVGGWLGLRLGLTYRYDNRREGIEGWNPARGPGRRSFPGALARLIGRRRALAR